MSYYEDAGFPGCGGCIDFMKLLWKHCPLAEKGKFRNIKERKLATILAVGWCDLNLYVWSCLVGRAGTSTDLNVLEVSPLSQNIVRGKFNFSI